MEAVRKNGNKGIGSALIDSALQVLKDEDIHKVALVVFKNNEIGNTVWERRGFSIREDLNYRNKALADLKRIDTYNDKYRSAKKLL